MSRRTWHDAYREARTAGDAVADKVAGFVGSWTFVYVHIVWFGVWVFYPVEPFPYGMLTMLVSLEAILLSTLIMMAQNRQADRDRHQAEADYDTNLKAKDEIEDVQRALARIENEKLDKILRILEQK
ncbi:DUF1003 domain-containing protein [Candidatus Kaiserbacteria bacterium]|nr:DUF1003 domain-containing protein [Candidatus Kaiserbacteria bacterium]